MQTKTFSTTVGGKEMIAEFTDLAEQANGSVILRYGNTAVLATAVISSRTRDDIDYFPLTVDYEERFYAAGQILGSRFVRREGRPSEQAILSGRVVDRTIRPLFPHHLRNEVQVIITILSLDEEDPDVLAVNAASLALATSDIPWKGPVAAVRIGILGEPSAMSSASGRSPLAPQPDIATGFVVNPTYKQREQASLDMLVCGKDSTINMIEVGAHEASEAEVAAGFSRAVEEHNKILAWQHSIVKELGKTKRLAASPEIPTALSELFETEFAKKLEAAVFCGTPGKDAIHEVQDEWKEAIASQNASPQRVGRDSASESFAPLIHMGQAKRYFEDKVDEIIHDGALKGKRADNRGFGEVRPLFAKAGGISPILHGSGIFYRGGTHVFTALTLGGPGDSQVVDTMEEHDVKKRFMHHYNFPPFSSGETGRMGGLNRRMIGHGALAEKALAAVIPPVDKFPYTIRLVSECFASNGSTSMGSVCASTIALMDGGVPIKAPVAGIAMGLMLSMHGDGKYKVLTDIQGPEDEFGDMDFKVAGTVSGITAIQMDIKLDGVPVPILVEALEGAKQARLHILGVIEKEIAAPRAQISSRAPEIITMKVRPEQIGLVIGGGGKTINAIRDTSGVDDITIEDDGSIFITGKNGSASKAQALIESLVKEYKVGEVYDGEVTRMMDFGAFVRIGPGKDAEGLVHVSEVAPFRINKIGDAVSVGEKVRVMIKEIDEKGRLNLSIKAADPEFASRKGLNPNGSTETKRTSPKAENSEANLPAQEGSERGTPQENLAQPLETFQSDIDKYVRENDVSPRELAAARKNFKGTPPQAPAPTAATPPPAPSAPPPIEPHSMLLPNKEVHSPTNAIRVNAGVLLNQETEATLPKVAPPPLPPVVPPKSKTATPPIETYQGDIQTYVKEKNVSTVTMAAAEERRRDEQAEPIIVGQGRTFTMKAILIFGGIALIGASLGALAYVYMTQRALPAQQSANAPFIAVDETIPVSLATEISRSDVMQALAQAKNNVKLSVGLVAALVPMVAGSNTAVDAQTFFGALTPNIPSQLLRTLQPNFLLGVHSFDVNQPFIILSTDSYEGGYAGMLAWEETMQADLSPLFEYTPVSDAPPQLTAGTSTASTTPTLSAPAVLQSTFTDTIVENHDARAITDSAGNIELLWTFLDRNTILITTNTNTVKEVISRIKTAPTITIPQ